ncbi:hypothetical protein [Nonlabens sp. MB-3u-79]|nr:hypothetical protein [Nonlabens sp. MB-3u-79]
MLRHLFVCLAFAKAESKTGVQQLLPIEVIFIILKLVDLIDI